MKRPFLILILSIAAVFQQGCDDIRYRVILPDGYIGWVRVDFGIPSAPALEINQSGYEATVMVPESGVVATRSNILVGMHDFYDFYYQEPNGFKRVPKSLYVKNLDAGGFTAKDTKSPLAIKPLSWYFFIGPKSLRNNIGRNTTTADLAKGIPLPTPGRILHDHPVLRSQ